MSNVYDLLLSQGFIRFPEEESNVIQADKAFFGSRAIQWIQKRAPDADFNLQAYLVALTYYKLGLADLKFEEDELLYRYRGAVLGGIEGEFSKDNPKVAGEFHRPDQIVNSDGTVSGGADHQEPSEDNE